jgi:hypothetical protein
VVKNTGNCHCFDTFAKFINISSNNFSFKNFTIFFILWQKHGFHINLWVFQKNCNEIFSRIFAKVHATFSFQTLGGGGDDSEKCLGSAAKHAALFCV